MEGIFTHERKCVSWGVCDLDLWPPTTTFHSVHLWVQVHVSTRCNEILSRLRNGEVTVTLTFDPRTGSCGLVKSDKLPQGMSLKLLSPQPLWYFTFGNKLNKNLDIIYLEFNITKRIELCLILSALRFEKYRDKHESLIRKRFLLQKYLYSL